MTDQAPASRSGGSAGFTLVELMIALVVIAIGIIALSGVQTRSSRDVYATGRGTQALAIAEDRVERIHSAGYAAAVSDSGQTTIFNWAARVDSAGQDLKSVDVTVTWPEQGQPRTVELRTLLALR